LEAAAASSRTNCGIVSPSAFTVFEVEDQRELGRRVYRPQHQVSGFKPTSRLEAIAQADEKEGSCEYSAILF
jgi:hypothetical protein